MNSFRKSSLKSGASWELTTLMKKAKSNIYYLKKYEFQPHSRQLFYLFNLRYIINFALAFKANFLNNSIQ